MEEVLKITIKLRGFNNHKALHMHIPGKTPANPSAFSISSSTGNPAIERSLLWPSKDEDGYIFVPIPSLRPVSFAIAR